MKSYLRRQRLDRLRGRLAAPKVQPPFIQATVFINGRPNDLPAFQLMRGETVVRDTSCVYTGDHLRIELRRLN